MIEVVSEPSCLIDPQLLDGVSRRIQAVAREVAANEHVIFGDVTVLVVSTERISTLHQQFFNDPSPTDVITFPGLTHPEGERLDGDIAICVDIAREQAIAEGHALDDEIVFLALHGLLHLCGWDDGSDAERRVMLARQTEIMQSAGRTSNAS